MVYNYSLIDFKKSKCQPEKRYTFTIGSMRGLSYPDEQGGAILETGIFTISLGALQSSFRLTGKIMLQINL